MRPMVAGAQRSGAQWSPDGEFTTGYCSVTSTTSSLHPRPLAPGRPSPGQVTCRSMKTSRRNAGRGRSVHHCSGTT